MAPDNSKDKKKKLTSSTIAGILIGSWLTGSGVYYGLTHQKMISYLAIFLGITLYGLVFWNLRE